MPATSTAQDPATVRRPAGQSQKLADVVKAAKKRGNKLILHGAEGWGKTSFAAQAKDPLFLMTGTEDGLPKLIENGLLGETPHYPEPFTDWQEFRTAIQEIIVTENVSFSTIVIDVINWAERMCMDYICRKDFGSSWESYHAFARGRNMLIPEWQDFLKQLNRLSDKGMNLILLAHTKIRPFKNPEGEDYDRYTPDMEEPIWLLTYRWADICLFAQFETYIDEKASKRGSKIKMTGGSQRMVYTQRTAAYDAKNRHNLPEEIDGGNSAQEAWANFVAALSEGRKKTKASSS